jgi:hypothetical protein
MAKQIVVNKQTGERFETTTWLRTAEVVRITGNNGLRSCWKPIAENGGELQLFAGEIAMFGKYLRPVVSQPKPSAVQAAPMQTRWQNEPATEKQLDYLAKLRVRFELPLTKGQASRLIDAAREGDAAIEYEDGPSSIGEVY